MNIDLAGVGIGPFNLSVAALADELPELRTRFFDKRPAFAWHPGLLLPGARMQTSFLKDLVTAVRPTSPHSFVSYLVERGRFHAFLAAERGAVDRREFADYLAWVAGRVPSLRFGCEVHEVHARPHGFELVHAGGRTHARDLVLGTGRVPALPACARAVVGERCFHAIDVLERSLALTGARVAVIGGGQTGAEIVLELLRARWGTPREVTWISRRMNFEPLDESPFTNHLFSPGYVDAFHALERAKRVELLERHKLAGDGISGETLQALHEQLYARAVAGERGVELLPGRELVELREAAGGGFSLALHCGLEGVVEHDRADWVILCTGLREQLPRCVEPLLPELALDDRGRMQVGQRFMVARRDPSAAGRMYVVNGGRESHGVAESQLSLMAWRSALILDDVLGRPHFVPRDRRELELVRWRSRDEVRE